MWLLWESFVKVKVLGSDSWFIHCNVDLSMNGKDESFVLSCVYGNPKVAIRKMQWAVLPLLKPQNDAKWIVMGDFNEKLEQIQYEILTHTDPGDDLFAAEHTQIQRYNDLLVQQATHWGQKSCSDWYKFGDLNTKYFHALVKCRRQKSFIHRISDPTGAILTKRQQIGDILTEFFAYLMTTYTPSFDSEILNVETPALSTKDLLCLAKPIDNKEILFALKQMHPFKAPGPDSFQAIFFHHLWHLVGPQKSIHDNALLANEFYHKIRGHGNRKSKFFALKIEMQKAFDKLEWSFLKIVLTKFGFPIDWINRIMFCVEKASYSILLNGAAHAWFLQTNQREGNSCADCLASHAASLASKDTWRQHPNAENTSWNPPEMG
ncbi:hypothetical protein IFM89_035846 [Coptis chinensis]|uniref:Reverse transcriptase domain-containing protein n=1 Tax=Coptis chinensis TaxID=261450 RepID=A0A835LQ82_9MAGN|nr:hypothetical protein IFM89_035846 [Coptis chinensis]